MTGSPHPDVERMVAEFEAPCRRLAVDGHCVVISLEYRLAPETRFPGPLEDCLSALRWLAGHGTELGGDGEPLSLVGDTAGANLAAASALCAGR